MLSQSRRLIRVIKLLRLFDQRRGRTADGIAKLLGVTRRTFFRDLQALRAAGVPIVNDEKTHIYFLKRDQHRRPTDLTVDELFAMWAISATVQNHHVPFYSDLKTAVKKIVRSTSPAARRKFSRMTRCIEFTSRKLADLSQIVVNYRVILDAIASLQEIKMAYRVLNGTELRETTFRPYRLIFNEYSWYVVGHSSNHNELRLFNLVSITEPRLTKTKFSKPRNFSWEAIAGDAWNISPGPHKQRNIVILRFSAVVAPSIARVQWHKSQQLRPMNDGSLLFKVKVSGYGEISWWIMRYGEHVEVLFPKVLRLSVAARLGRAAAMYAPEHEVKRVRSPSLQDY